MLKALISYFPEKEGVTGVGALEYPPEERRKLAKMSKSFSCPQCGPIVKLLPEEEEETKTKEPEREKKEEPKQEKEGIPEEHKISDDLLNLEEEVIAEKQDPQESEILATKPEHKEQHDFSDTSKKRYEVKPNLARINRELFGSFGPDELNFEAIESGRK